jgi:hypothetical protein
LAAAAEREPQEILLQTTLLEVLEVLELIYILLGAQPLLLAKTYLELIGLQEVEEEELTELLGTTV